MSRYVAEKRKRYTKPVLAVLVYLLATLLVCGAINQLCAVGYMAVWYPGTGEYDLTDFDFEHDIAELASWAPHFQHYLEAFYTPEDFASGRMNEVQPYQGNSSYMGEYGTLRMVLTLPPGQVYALTAKNASYAQRLYIGGTEYLSIGEPGDNPEATFPQTRRYFAAFQPDGETTELIIHYADFAYGDGGGLYPVQLGLAENIHRAEQLRSIRVVAVTVALLVALLLFFGLFLLFPKNRYLLWFALACGCVSLRGLFIDDKVIMVLLPELDWYLAIRLEFMLTLGACLFTGLYIQSLFPGRIRRWVGWANTAWCGGGMLYLCLVPPHVFSQHIERIVIASAVLVVCLLVLVLVDAVRKRLASPLSKMEQALLLSGLGLYALLSVVGIRAHSAPAKLFGLGYPQVAMIAFLFINIIALVMGFSRTEQERDAALAAEREIQETNAMLERLNHIRAVYFANITHEMKTPLAGIRAMAQFSKARMKKEGMLDGETARDLDEIAQRAGDLSAFTGRLLELSAAQDERLDFDQVEVAELFAQAARAMTPAVKERGNSLSIRLPGSLPPLCGVGDLLVQALRNLIANANRHCSGIEITLSAEMASDGMVELQVTDRGDGVPPELLPQVFTRGVSGDGSTGLGLAICKEIAETHGGRIWIENRPGGGTRVRFTIPAAKEELEL